MTGEHHPTTLRVIVTMAGRRVAYTRPTWLYRWAVYGSDGRLIRHGCAWTKKGMIRDANRA